MVTQAQAMFVFVVGLLITMLGTGGVEASFFGGPQRKVRTPQGSAPLEKGGRSRQGGRTESAAESEPPMARKGTGKGEKVE